MMYVIADALAEGEDVEVDVESWQILSVNPIVPLFEVV
jgi:hypothetical protein